MLKICDTIIRIFSGGFLLIAIPGLVCLIREDINTMHELREKGLL